MKHALTALLLCLLVVCTSSAFADDLAPVDSASVASNSAPSDSSSIAGNSAPQAISSGIRLFGQVGKFDALTDDVQRAIGIKCITKDGETVITDVLKGSDAFNSGLHAGDPIFDAARKDDYFELSILNKAGNPASYTFQLKAQHEQFTARIPRPETVTRPPVLLNAIKQQPKLDSMPPPAQAPLFGTITEAAKILSSYDVELIVDKSLSMRRRDCPGMMSRWEWCASQSQELGRQLAPFVPQGLSIIPFARMYDSYEHQQPQQIASMFFNTELERGTRLAEPLSDRLNRALYRRAQGAKPTVIAIITDGVPAPAYEPQMVIDVLINASKQMRSPQDITVVFFQIGAQDPFGQRYLSDLNNNLVSWGARFNYVHTVSFKQLQQYGLARSLVDSLRALQSQQRH